MFNVTGNFQYGTYHSNYPDKINGFQTMVMQMLLGKLLRSSMSVLISNSSTISTLQLTGSANIVTTSSCSVSHSLHTVVWVVHFLGQTLVRPSTAVSISQSTITRL